MNHHLFFHSNWKLLPGLDHLSKLKHFELKFIFENISTDILINHQVQQLRGEVYTAKIKLNESWRQQRNVINIEDHGTEVLSPRKKQRQSSLCHEERRFLLEQSTLQITTSDNTVHIHEIYTGNKKIIIKIVFRWCLHRYYSMILSRCYYKTS